MDLPLWRQWNRWKTIATGEHFVEKREVPQPAEASRNSPSHSFVKWMSLLLNSTYQGTTKKERWLGNDKSRKWSSECTRRRKSGGCFL